jgi:KUP system potassium uptake protein
VSGHCSGPVMVLWFAILAALGAAAIIENPSVLAAINPLYAFNFLQGNSVLGFFALGAVVLCITGAEALYADMGHFGARPIQYAWLGYVLPALLINYFGQGALLLADPSTVENPFYLLAPEWGRYPLVILATMATIIASQAVISGAFSITQQAMQLGYTPRLAIQHTSDREMGQIYLPAINWLLLISIILLVVEFGSSSKLAAAYGIAVTGTMLITNILAIAVGDSPMGLEPDAGGPRCPALHLYRPRFLPGQLGEDSRWWLVPAGFRVGCLHIADHLETRPRTFGRAPGGRCHAIATLHHQHCREWR